MNPVGIQTAILVEESDPENGYRLIAQAGFDCIDFNLDAMLPGEKIQSGDFGPLFRGEGSELESYLERHRAAARKNGLFFSQMHAPFQLYVPERDDINELCFGALEKCIAGAALLGCPNLVVHPVNLAYQKGCAEETRVNLAYFGRLASAAKKYGVTVCLENMFVSVGGHVSEAVCSDFPAAARLIDELNGEAGAQVFGFCLDIGHMTLLGKNMRESIRTLGPRIRTLHIHDNDGVQDHHAMPYSYARNWGRNPVTDWEGFLAGLREIGYRGPLSFETAGSLKIMPKELYPAEAAYIAVAIIAAAVVIVIVLYKWRQKAREAKEREEKRTQEILNTPLEKFGDKDLDDLAKKYEKDAADGKNTKGGTDAGGNGSDGGTQQ